MFLVLGIVACFLEVLHNLGKIRSILARGSPALFVYLTVLTLYESRVHAVHHGMLLVSIGFFACIELLSLFLCYALIVVAGTGKQQVLSVSQIYSLCHDVRVEDNLSQFIAAFGLLHKPFAAKLRDKLLAAVVVVDTI